MRIPFFGTRNNLILLTLLLVSIVGILIGFNTKAALYVLGVVGLFGYIFLCIARPFAAFGVLIALGLTVWLSGISLIGGFSVLVGVGLVFVGIWVARLALHRTQFLWWRELWPILGFLAAMGLSMAINWGGPAGFTNIFTYLQLLLLIILVVNFANTPDRLNTLGIIFVITSALMGLMILLDQAGLLPVGLVNNVTGNVTFAGTLDTFERSGGIFGDPNFAALQLLAGLPFVIAFWAVGRGWQKAGLALAGVLIVAGLLYTYSVGGLVGLVVILLLITFFTGRRNLLVITMRVALLGVVCWWLANNVLPKYYLERVWENINLINQLFDSYDMDLLLQLGTERGDTWSAAFNTFLQSPLWGHGPGNAAFLNPMNSAFGSHMPRMAAHNFLLAVANDIGLIGLFFFVALLVLAVRASKPGPGEHFPVRDAVFVALIATMVQGLAIDTQKQKLLWIFLGMAFSIKMQSFSSMSLFRSNEDL